MQILLSNAFQLKKKKKVLHGSQARHQLLPRGITHCASLMPHPVGEPPPNHRDHLITLPGCADPRSLQAPHFLLKYFPYFLETVASLLLWGVVVT